MNGVSCKSIHGNNDMLKIMNKNQLVFQLNADAVYKNRIWRIPRTITGPDNANDSVKRMSDDWQQMTPPPSQLLQWFCRNKKFKIMTGNNEGQGHMTLLLHNTNMN